MNFDFNHEQVFILFQKKEQLVIAMVFHARFIMLDQLTTSNFEVNSYYFFLIYNNTFIAIVDIKEQRLSLSSVLAVLLSVSIGQLQS